MWLLQVVLVIRFMALCQHLNSNSTTQVSVEVKCPVKWSWGPWSDCDPSTCTRYRRRRCELPMRCSRQVCMLEKYAKKRAIVRRYRPCNLRDTLRICKKRIGPPKWHWGAKRSVNLNNKSRFSKFLEKPSRIRRHLIPVYLNKSDFLGFPLKKASRVTPRSKSPFTTFFTAWSSWSKCEFMGISKSRKAYKICAQIRTRTCQFSAICGDFVLLHRRRCRSSICRINLLKNISTSTSPTNTGNSIHFEDKKIAGNVFKIIKHPIPAVTPSTLKPEPVKQLDYSMPKEISIAQERCGISKVAVKRKSARIIGGRLVPRGKWPWMVVLINRRGEQFCGGVLIGRNWVLTAAHCLDRVASVRLGEHSLDRFDIGELSVRPAAVFAHPRYNPDDFDSDIGLVLLDQPLNFTKFIHPVCTPPSERKRPPAPYGTPEVGGGLRAGTLCTVVGWGKLAEHYPTGSSRPREVKVPIVSRNSCRKAYSNQLTKTQLCAGYLQGGRDSCGGDSGGPLLCQQPVTVTEHLVGKGGKSQKRSRAAYRWVVEGLVSHGDGCGLQMKYGVYTRVDAFIDWIYMVINKPEAFLYGRGK